uniref:Amphiregulin n=1 Tax=Poecilia latipinna TaxID=48699 RepID=A0A3B3V936_9TELE
TSNPQIMFSSFVGGCYKDPCTSTHLGFCIHGYCKYIEGLKEPVCICMKGYDGERCGIQTLGSFIPPTQSYNSDLVQTVLVVIAVVLSVISCCAILANHRQTNSITMAEVVKLNALAKTLNHFCLISQH